MMVLRWLGGGGARLMHTMPNGRARARQSTQPASQAPIARRDAPENPAPIDPHDYPRNPLLVIAFHCQRHIVGAGLVDS